MELFLLVGVIFFIASTFPWKLVPLREVPMEAYIGNLTFVFSVRAPTYVIPPCNS